MPSAKHSRRDVIVSKTLNPTNTRGIRVRVSGWNSWMAFPWDHRYDAHENHRHAVEHFLRENAIDGTFYNGYNGREHVWVLVENT